MHIGSKIKKAREEAGFIQDYVAESLGVSRQTISNWENGKTYPDILSVVKMSDLYHVSLDHLLKADEGRDTYVAHIHETSNVVKSKTQMSKLILIMVYLVIWSMGIMAFWFFVSGSDAMTYSLAFLWVILPLTSIVTSFVIGLNDYWGRYKWCWALGMGLMYMLAEYVTFGAANMVTFDHLNIPSFGMLVGGTLVSFIGILVASLIKRHKKKLIGLAVSALVLTGCSRQVAEYAFLVGDRYEEELSQVEMIQICEGGRGQVYETTDPDEIEAITSLLGQVTCQLSENQENLNGWTYYIDFYQGIDEDSWFRFSFGASPISYFNGQGDVDKEDQRNYDLSNDKAVRDLLATYFQD